MEISAIPVPFKKLKEEATIPTFGKSYTDAGMDMYAAHSMTIHSGSSAIVDTGVAWDGATLITEFEKPVLIVKSRSGLAFNEQIETSNAGVIDAGYRGSIKVRLYNHSDRPFVIHRGDRIAQAILYFIPLCAPLEIKEFSTAETVRGDNGFGSTGK
jgi:dUTP pyrophosphatase